MARITMQEAAFKNIDRLYNFLAEHDEDIANRAIGDIDKGISQLAQYLEEDDDMPWLDD